MKGKEYGWFKRKFSKQRQRGCGNMQKTDHTKEDCLRKLTKSKTKEMVVKKRDDTKEGCLS